MKELIEKLNQSFAAFEKDARLQSEKDNKSAGLRARKAAAAMIKDLKEFRKVSMEASK